jgi:methionyl aminopeptidase
MESKEIQQWRKAGNIAAQLMAHAKKLAKPETPLLEIAESVEAKLAELKAETSFPINLSINEIAAHFTPAYNDETLANGLLKIDLGANVDGFISDMACSIDLTPEQKHKDLIRASQTALEEAVKIIKPGIMLCEIGHVIQDTISSFDLAPVRNLSGHELQQWNLHAGLTVPNYDSGSTIKLEKGAVFAIEPFATYGEGIVQDGRPSGIYMLQEKKSVRDPEARKLLEFIEKTYQTLPFSARWLVKKFGTRALVSLRMLEQANTLHHFRQLVEKSKACVSQAEHTILVTEDGCEILTK